MKRISIFILLTFCAIRILAQSPEQVVSDYVRLLNDWLASPYDTQKKNKVVAMLKPNGKECTMNDEIVATYNKDCGDGNTKVSNYLTIFSNCYKESGKVTSVELVCTKDMSNDVLVKVNAVLNYSGGINITTAASFWIFDKRIGNIVTSDEERYWLMNNPCTITTTTAVVNSHPISQQGKEHEFVDLGLPSGTLWATCNVGANNPWEYGDYFAWGEITPKTDYSWSNYKYANGARNKLTKYCWYEQSGNDGYTDSLTILESKDDAATANWGSNWCMPKIGQWQELKDNCTWEQTTCHGIKGCKVLGSNGNSIFLPMAGQKIELGELRLVGDLGYYWSSSISWANPDEAKYFYCILCKIGWYGRVTGLSVRPVRCQNSQ